MRFARVYLAGVVLGATFVAAVWLYTYRTWDTLVDRDIPTGQFVLGERISRQPWWGVYGAFAVLIAGAALSLWLLPEGRRLFRQFVVRLAGRRRLYEGG